ncbi:MAG: sensor histidine kinase [Acutalibacteraceae bacterium]
MDYFIEITCVESIIWFVLFYVIHNKLTVRFFIAPLITAGLFMYMCVYSFQDWTYYLTAIILYFLTPVFLTSKVKKTAVVYVSLITPAIFYFVYNFIYFSLNFIGIPFIALAYGLSLLISITGIILIYKNNDINNILKLISVKTKIILLAYVWILLFLVTELNFYLSDIHTDIAYIITFFMYLTVLGTGVVIFMLIKNIRKSSYYENLSMTMEVKLTEQVKYYEQLERADNELRKFRHNYNNMKIGLMSLLRNKDISGAEKYVADCDNTLHSSYTLYQTGNSIVNAILSDKAMKAKEEGIVISFNGIIPETKISNTDLCIIFGNILDNAIESAIKLEDNIAKEINISVNKKKDYLFITVTNPTKDEVVIKNNKVVTTKIDKHNHGLGLISVEDTVKKYDGHLNLDYNNNLFTITFDLCIY